MLCTDGKYKCKTRGGEYGDDITTVIASYTFFQIYESTSTEIFLRLLAQCRYLTIFSKQVSEFH